MPLFLIKIQLKLEQRDDGLFLKTNLFNAVPAKTDGVISTDTIMMAFEPEENMKTLMVLQLYLTLISLVLIEKELK